MGVLQNFVVFEGGDGSGTSTQLGILKQRFAGGGPGALPPLVATFEPTGGPVGHFLRSALRGDIQLLGETMARLFSADRAEHLYKEDGVVQLAKRGSLVVCDRYTLSSRVYQGIECGDELPVILNKDFPAPELLLYFDVDPIIAFERCKQRSQRDIYERLNFQIQVRGRYRSLLDSCRAEGSCVVEIDASAAIDSVAQVVWRNISQLPIMKGCTGQ
ncbi:MAG: dTMP kinase [Spirochaetaceae bacterium]|jgi:dTMP kinase|nr:dTMP kinase [Spirochaetaceae bacterium]